MSHARPNRGTPPGSHRFSPGWILLTAAVCGVSLAFGGFVLPAWLGWASAIAAGPATTNQAKTPESVAADPAPKARPPVEAATALAPERPARRPASVNLSVPTTPPVLDDRPSHRLSKTINEQIAAALSRAGVAPSPIADDAEFLRRAYLDLTGRIPSHGQAVAFLSSSDARKRTQLIDELVESPEFGQRFANIWTDILIKRDADTNRNLKTEAFAAWFANQLNSGRGWDKIVSDMITASGNVESAPQTLFILANQDNFQVSPAKLVGSTANLFMGLQLQCAECHVHPTTDAWKPDDFWSLAAFFGHTVFERDDPKVARGPVVAVREVARKAEPKGKAAKMGAKAIPPTDTIAIPDPTDAKKTIGTARARLFESDRPANLGSNVPYRPRLAAWLTAPDNKYFARATVNRFWAHLFARGLIHPVEDMGPDSVASHPELLDALAREFAASGFDVKFLLRAYCNSDAYHRTSRPTSANADDETLLSRMPIKVIGARELLASLQVATDSRAPALSRDQAKALRKEMAKNKGLNAPAGGVRFFDKREYEDEVTDFSYGIPQMLKLMNTPLTNAGATVARLGKPNRDRADVVVDLYLAALTRKPTERELDRLLAYLDQKPATGYADIFWSLLNCAEFVSNH